MSFYRSKIYVILQFTLVLIKKKHLHKKKATVLQRISSINKNGFSIWRGRSGFYWRELIFSQFFQRTLGYEEIMSWNHGCQLWLGGNGCSQSLKYTGYKVILLSAWFHYYFLYFGILSPIISQRLLLSSFVRILQIEVTWCG